MEPQFILILVLYFLPYVIAELRGHRLRNSILVVNLFFGWTLVGWVIALAFAVGPRR